jgi:hypothetical protein
MIDGLSARKKARHPVIAPLRRHGSHDAKIMPGHDFLKM